MDFYIGGKTVKTGETIFDFRGEQGTFKRISRESEPGKSGKVIVHYADADKGYDCELYPTVFDGEIR